MNRSFAILVLPAALFAGACAASGHSSSDEGTLPDGGTTSSSSGGGGADGGALPTSSLAALSATCSGPSLGSPVLRLLTRAEFDSTMNDVFPQVKGQWTDSLPADELSAMSFENDSARSVGDQIAQGLLATAQSIAEAVTASPVFATILPCSATTADRTCATQFLTQYGKLLFRRPMTSAEQTTYLAFFDSSLAKSNFQKAIEWMTVGLIQSPNTVYRSEIGTPGSDGTRHLSPYELATEASYTFTGHPPTADVLSMADNGSIGDPVALAKQLLSTPNGQAALQHFFVDYLGYTKVQAIDKPNVQAFASVSSDMVQETQSFLNSVVFQQGGTLKDLLTSPTTNPSKNLASYYGFPAPQTDFASTPRPAGKGIGVLAQGSFLAVRSDATSSSPTLRGLFMYAQLLCHDIPPVPNTVPSIASSSDGGPITTRDRFELEHATNAYCAGCHQQWDPMGFGLESFDEGGRFRTTENGLPVDPSGWVPDPTQQMPTDAGSVRYAPVFSFADEEGLANGLASLPVVARCFAGYLATYAYGSSQPCLGASKIADLQSGAIGIAEAFADLAAEPHFAQRASE